jgi:hypothetical protein
MEPNEFLWKPKLLDGGQGRRLVPINIRAADTT